MRKIALTIALLTAVAFAQVAGVGTHLAPTDTIRGTVTFKEPMKLLGGYVRFRLVGSPETDQQGFETAIEANFSIPDGTANKKEYEFAGTVPDKIASGNYQAELISVNVENHGKVYRVESDFPPPPPVPVKNPRKAPRFSTVEKITVQPIK